MLLIWGCVLCAVPPRWVVEPTDASVERNKHVILHCQAQGVPQPTVIWKKATGMPAENEVCLHTEWQAGVG
jgi:hypothetical protein